MGGGKCYSIGIGSFSDMHGLYKEFYENDQSIVIEETERDQSVNLYGCKNVVVQVKGKVNAVTMSGSSVEIKEIF